MLIVYIDLVILGRHGSRRSTRCGKHEGQHG